MAGKESKETGYEPSEPYLISGQVSQLLGAPDPQTPEAAEERILLLRSLLIRLNRAYYDLDKPLAQDEDYDRLLRMLETLEDRWPEYASDDSPTRRVGGQVSTKFTPVPHRFPMLSLLDVFSREEIESFISKVQEREGESPFLVQMKIDGLSVSLTYREGRLVQAVTRGDGVTSGEDITENILQIKAVPARLTQTVPELVVRGEVYMPFASFDRLNREEEESGGKPFANPRNAAAGTLRQLDSSVVARRDLSFFAFDLQYAARTFDSDSDSLVWLKELGLPVIPDWILADNYEAVMEAVDRIEARRDTLPFGIDGAVIKLDRMDRRQALGGTPKYPRWSVAYKYPPEQKETRIIDITAQVGRTGRITPLAWLEPVKLAWTIVRKATLHNQSYIDQLDCRIGDTVLVQKGGDIIPAVVRVILEKRPPGTQAYRLPDHCPACGSRTEFTGGGVDLYCTGVDCPAQLVRHLTYFASKEAMDIAGLGDKTAAALTEKGYVRSIADLYSLREKRSQLIEDGSIGRQKSVDKLLQEIEESKKAGPERLLTGFGIPLVGRQTAKALLARIPDIRKLAASSQESLSEIRDVGLITAGEIVNWFSLPQSVRLLERLESYGLPLEESPREAGPLDGQTFVLTGTLSSMTRTEARDALEKLGARVSGSVSSQTSMVIIGDKPGSKADRARDLNLAVMDEDQFVSWLESLGREEIQT